MLPVFVYEKDIERLHYLCNIIYYAITFEDWDIDIAYASDSYKELVNTQLTLSSPSLYFIDLENESKKNAFFLLQQIRDNDPRGFIVILDRSLKASDFLLQSHLEILDYIKTIDYSQIPLLMKKCMHLALSRFQTENNRTGRQLVLHQSGHIISLSHHSIYYIRSLSNSHLIVLYTNDGQRYYRCTLNNLLPILGTNFVFCSRNCIVNLEHIKEINTSKKEITLITDEILSLSCRRVKSFCISYENYII